MSKAFQTPSNLKSIRYTMSGMTEYLRKINNLGKNIRVIAETAVVTGAKPIYSEIYTGVAAHNKTASGASLESVDIAGPYWEGNTVVVDVGINTKIKYLAWHWVFVEWGSPTNIPADPVVHDAFDNNARKTRNIMKKILQNEAVI